MRKFLTTLIAASAIALPATAATLSDGPTDDGPRRGHTRAEAGGELGERAGRANDDGVQRAERVRPERPQMPAVPDDRVSRTAMPSDRQETAIGAQAWQRAPDGGQRDRRSDRRGGDWNRERNDAGQSNAVLTHRQDQPNGSFARRVGRGGARPDQWTRNWRDDRRYDWRNYRTQNRSQFQIGVYYDPYGSNYRRWNVGWSMRPNYYRSAYWISDPWQYRLPETYGPFHWVRYYDDAVLVNTFSGEVVDVIYNFFW